MDFRFLVAGILAAALGYISGATVFAAAPRPALDPALAQAARDRAAVATEVTAPLPPTTKLPELPALPPPPKLPGVNAVAKIAPRVRVVVVHRRTTTPTTSGRPAHRAEHEREHEGSDHERGDD
jgi:hypothetical protein